MKVVILAGGLGTRLSEETHLRPKPMVEIGGMPILWHIMKLYSHYGLREFIICCGYKGYVIKEFFTNYMAHVSDISIDMSASEIEILAKRSEPWKVTLIDTGESTQTGGRIKRIEHLIKNEVFALTYGDGVSNVNISALIKHHKDQNRKLTLTAVRPPARFGALTLDGHNVTAFQEKPLGEGSRINGGFFICEPEIFSVLDGDQCIFEETPMKIMVRTKQINAYIHDGFWHPMDTLRDKTILEKRWASGNAEWKVW